MTHVFVLIIRRQNFVCSTYVSLTSPSTAHKQQDKFMWVTGIDLSLLLMDCSRFGQQNTLTCCQCAQTSIVHYSFIQYFFIYWMLVACTLFFLPNIWLCCTWWVATITIYLYPVFD